MFSSRFWTPRMFDSRHWKATGGVAVIVAQPFARSRVQEPMRMRAQQPMRHQVRSTA